MTDDMKRTYTRKHRSGWLQWLAVVVVSAVIGMGGTVVVLSHHIDRANAKAEKSDEAMKSLFFRFCVQLANKYPTADAESKKVCDSIWQGTLAASRDSGVSVSPFRMAQIIAVESGFDHRAISHATAFGLAQIHVPAYGQRPFGCDILEPVCNVYTGAMIYAKAIKAYGDERLALTAYQRGHGATNRSIRAGESPHTGYAKKVMSI